MTASTIRLDKWLWYARFFISRTVAGKACTSGKVRVNDIAVSKANVLVGPGDVLAFAKGDLLKVINIKAVGHRRGPAPEAQTLYEDLSPPPPSKDDKTRAAGPAYREPGQGRPTKAERRATDKLKDFD